MPASPRTPMSDFLAAMAAYSRSRAAEIKRGDGAFRLAARAKAARPPTPLVLAADGFDLIAETKLSSPSQGRLVGRGDDAATVLGLAASMAGAGAAALSVLTEPTRFDGAWEHLDLVAGTLDIPVMCKDFLVDPVQVLQARGAGASGVLLIARILEPEALAEMADLALSLGMFVLVEVFEERDIDIASSVFDRGVLVGVNARDLATLGIDRERHRRLAPLLPAHLPAVAESGVCGTGDVSMLAALGYRLALVGSALMVGADAGLLAGEMIRAGRRAAGIREAW